jgi:hypothetical protein
MPKPLTLLLLCSLMILSASCRLPISIVDAECDSLTCLSQAWSRAQSTPILEAECNLVTAAPLRELIQDDDLILTASDEIIRRFELSADELHTETGDRYRLFTWWYLGNRYTLYLQEEERPLGNVFFEKSPPFLWQVIECLGAPEWYDYGYGPWHELFGLSLSLYFPEYGFRASSSQVTRQQNIVIDEDLTATRLSITPSGTTEEVISFLNFDSPEGAQITLERLKPWSGSLETVIETIRTNYCLDYPAFCPTDEQ